jgi:hypothetical protein
VSAASQFAEVRQAAVEALVDIPLEVCDGATRRAWMPRPGSAMADAESVAAAEIAMASPSRPETPSVGQQIWRPDYGRRRDTAGGGHGELLPRGHAGHDWRRHVPETEHHLTSGFRG